MDTLRGPFDTNDLYDDTVDFDAVDDDGANDLPPSPIGQDERRMQVRAYNHWASQLGDGNFPSIEDLEPAEIDDFGPYSVLLDFSKGIEDPAIQFLGTELATECGTETQIKQLSDVPSRSLLSRITDHYMQILANQAPIGFEAEFINDAGITIMYRGILLPYSSDEETIDFIYGVINWKEMADRLTADELLLEIDHALEGGQPPEADEIDNEESAPSPLELTDGWADGPSEADEHFDAAQEDDLAPAAAVDLDDTEIPAPDFGQFALGDDDDDGEEEANYDFASLTDHVAPPKPKMDALELGPEDVASQQDLWSVEPVAEDMSHDEADAIELAEASPSDMEELELENDVLELAEPVDALDLSEALSAPEMETLPAAEEVLPLAAAQFDAEAGLHDCLASARELAETARTCEDRSRSALYAAVGRAYDVSLAAIDAPEDYAELIAENGLSVQERAPMTPIVKLVFGADYDKTRLTEYAAVLSHAHRVGIERGALAEVLSDAEGGLKGLVAEERRLRKEEAGQIVEPKNAVRSALAKKLRKLDPQELADLATEGPEFGLVMIRRTPAGDVELIGEIEQDIALVERAARKLLG